MRISKFFFVVCSAAMIMSSCTAEKATDPDSITPEVLIGSYALDDGTGWTNAYISFTNVTMSEFKAENQTKVIAEQYIWHSGKDDFTKTNSGSYVVNNNILYYDGVPYGKIMIDKDRIIIGDKTYAKLIGFKEGYYSTISIEGETERSVSWQKQRIVIPVSVDKTIPSGRLCATTSASWLHPSLTYRILSIVIDESISEYSRSGVVNIDYPSAEQKSIRFTQKEGSVSLQIQPSSQNADYRGGNNSFTYSITNPREGISITPQSQVYWITDVVVNETSVTYKVAENNSGSSRTGNIRLSYSSLATRDFTVTQSYTASVIALSPASRQTDYTGGSFSFEYSVSNPREWATVMVQSQSNWITNVSVSGNKVSYRVSENVTPCDRMGLITLQYGVGNVVCASVSFQILQSVNPSVLEASDLSASGTSNCYIVPSSGVYKLKAVKGNSNTSVGTVASAEVLWESFGTSQSPNVGDIINSVGYLADYVYFSTPSALKNGNAVIAVKDSDGNILWSWHIWVCNGYNPASTAQVYYNNAGTMMDRNLGATSATPGDVGALGLLYQWGRKDPFLGSRNISSNTKAASTLSWPSAVTSTRSNGTIAYAVAHPTTFITYDSSNYDWYYTGGARTDNTRWQSSKTIYDPCPPGWRVHEGGENGVWSKARGGPGVFEYTWDSTNKGINFSGKFGVSSTVWYPAAGCLNGYSGNLYGVGSSGWWSSCRYCLYLNDNGYVDPSNGRNWAYGQSVRCLQE